MGELFQFGCTNCGFNAQVSGGDDAGMSVSTSTIVCQSCRQLYDVVIVNLDDDKGTKQHPPRCPKSGTHTVTRWNNGDQCPKCGEPLARGESVCLWD
jgi:hypothetical protein